MMGDEPSNCLLYGLVTKPMLNRGKSGVLGGVTKACPVKEASFN